MVFSNRSVSNTKLMPLHSMVDSPETTREEPWKKWDERHEEHNRKSLGRERGGRRGRNLHLSYCVVKKSLVKLE